MSHLQSYTLNIMNMNRHCGIALITDHKNHCKAFFVLCTVRYICLNICTYVCNGQKTSILIKKLRICKCGLQYQKQLLRSNSIAI